MPTAPAAAAEVVAVVAAVAVVANKVRSLTKETRDTLDGGKRGGVRSTTLSTFPTIAMKKGGTKRRRNTMINVTLQRCTQHEHGMKPSRHKKRELGNEARGRG